VSGALKTPITVATFHCSITALIGRLKNTHPLTPGKKQSYFVVSYSLAIGRTGAELKATNGHLGNEKATATRIAAINVDMMTTATVKTVGARWGCPRMQEHCRGSGVVAPDQWLTMRTVAAGGGHGPILLGKSEARGGVNCIEPETYQFLRQSMGRYFTSGRDFLHRACKKYRILVKKSN
jgi:hypothetical protein